MSSLELPKMATDCQPVNLSTSSQSSLQLTAEQSTNNSYHNSTSNKVSTEHQPTMSSKFHTVSSHRRSTSLPGRRINSQMDLNKQILRCAAEKINEFATCGNFTEEQLLKDLKVLGEPTHNCNGTEVCAETSCRCFKGGYFESMVDIAKGNIQADPASANRVEALEQSIEQYIGPVRVQEMNAHRLSQIKRSGSNLVLSSFKSMSLSQLESSKQTNGQPCSTEQEQQTKEKQAAFSDMLGTDFFSSTRQTSATPLPLTRCINGGFPKGRTKKERVANIMKHIMKTVYMPIPQKQEAGGQSANQQQNHVEDHLLSPFTVSVEKGQSRASHSVQRPMRVMHKPTPVQQRLAEAAVPPYMRGKGGVFGNILSVCNDQMRRPTTATSLFEQKTNGNSARLMAAPMSRPEITLQKGPATLTDVTKKVQMKRQDVLSIPDVVYVVAENTDNNSNDNVPVTVSLSAEQPQDDVVNYKSQNDQLINTEQKQQIQIIDAQPKENIAEESQLEQQQEKEVIFVEENAGVSAAPENIPEADSLPETFETSEPDASPSRLVIYIADDIPDSQAEAETVPTSPTANEVENQTKPTPQLPPSVLNIPNSQTEIESVPTTKEDENQTELTPKSRPFVVNIKLPKATFVAASTFAETSVKPSEQNATANEQQEQVSTKVVKVLAKPEAVNTASPSTPTRAPLKLRIRLIAQDDKTINYERIEDKEEVVEKEVDNNSYYSLPESPTPPIPSPITPVPPSSPSMPEPSTSDVTLTTNVIEETEDDVAVHVSPMATTNDEVVPSDNEVEMSTPPIPIVSAEEAIVTKTIQSAELPAVSASDSLHSSAEQSVVEEKSVTIVEEQEVANNDLNVSTTADVVEEQSAIVVEEESVAVVEKQEVINTDSKTTTTNADFSNNADVEDEILNKKVVKVPGSLSSNDIPVTNSDFLVAEKSIQVIEKEKERLAHSSTDRVIVKPQLTKSGKPSAKMVKHPENNFPLQNLFLPIVKKPVTEKETFFSPVLAATPSQSTSLSETVATSSLTETGTQMLARKRGRPRKDEQVRMVEQIKKQQEVSAAFAEERPRRSVGKKAEAAEEEEQLQTQTPTPNVEQTETTPTVEENDTPRRRRGRPRKYPFPLPLPTPKTTQNLVPESSSLPAVSLEESLDQIAPKSELVFENEESHVPDEQKSQQKDNVAKEVTENSNTSRPRTRLSSTEVAQEVAFAEDVPKSSKSPTKSVITEQLETAVPSTSSESTPKHARLSFADKASQKLPQNDGPSAGQVNKPDIFFVNNAEIVPISEQPMQTTFEKVPESAATKAVSESAGKDEQIRRSLRKRKILKAEDDDADSETELSQRPSTSSSGTSKKAKATEPAVEQGKSSQSVKRPTAPSEDEKDEEEQLSTRRSKRLVQKVERSFIESDDDEESDATPSEVSSSKSGSDFSFKTPKFSKTSQRLSTQVSSAKIKREEEEEGKKKMGNSMIVYGLDCRVCSQTFPPNELFEHLLKVHEQKPYICQFGCKNISFSNRKEIGDHYLLVHNVHNEKEKSKNKPWRCVWCSKDKTYTSYDTYYIHCRHEHQMGVFGCTWDECEKKDYPTRIACQKHITLVHKTSERRKKMLEALNIDPAKATIEDLAPLSHSSTPANKDKETLPEVGPSKDETRKSVRRASIVSVTSAASTSTTTISSSPLSKPSGTSSKRALEVDVKSEFQSKKIKRENKETLPQAGSSKDGIRKSVRRASIVSLTSAASTSTSTTTASIASPSKTMNTRRQAISSATASTPSTSDTKVVTANAVTPIRASGRIAKKKVPYEAEVGTSVSKSPKTPKTAAHKPSHRSSSSSSSPLTPSSKLKVSEKANAYLARHMQIANGFQNGYPDPRKYDSKEAEKKDVFTDNQKQSYHCLWPDCKHYSPYFWNLEAHIRGKHLGLPKTCKEAKEVLCLAGKENIDLSKWCHTHVHEKIKKSP